MTARRAHRSDATRRAAGRAPARVLAAALLLAGLVSCSKDDGDSGSRPGDGTLVGGGGDYRATITRTTDGVPHIAADTLADAAFGQGWASGEDHTCDLADQVVKLKSQRARWLGAGKDDANIDSDVAWASIGIYDRATTDWPKATKEVRDLLTAYTAGWNGHLEAVGADAVTGWCKGEPWVTALEPVDVYANARAIALSASGSQVAKYIPSAAPPDASSPPTTALGVGNLVRPDVTAPSSDDIDLAAFDQAMASLREDPFGSNGWAVGKDRTTAGDGMLVANPHFPWEGELRFWEVGLNVKGLGDAYGVQLTGLPGLGIGFTDEFAWTHTVSAGSRFTAYKLALQPGSPTTYRYGDEWKKMTSTTHHIKVLGGDGELRTVDRTTWASHYGPIIDFPGFGWSTDATISYRDANIDDTKFVDQYVGMLQAKDLDEFKAVHREVNGVPLFNTIAVSKDGRAWYADTSATPNLSDKAIATYEASLTTDPIAKIAADSRAILLDGSDPEMEWVDEPGARSPGLIPPDRQPQVERTDYVFSANDSYWMPNATHLLTGEFSPLQGRPGTVRSPRTRENAVVLDDTSAQGPSGADGTFTLDELADASLLNQGFMARSLRADVVARCEEAPGPVSVGELPGKDGVPGLPAGSVDLSTACQILDGWDGIYDLDRAGPPVWREFLGRFDIEDLRNAGKLWAKPFDPADPLTTPSGLAAAPASGDDPVLVNLARAVQTLEAAGFEADSTLGETQFALRNGIRVPIHGGNELDGTTNVVSFGSLGSTADPKVVDRKQDRLVTGSGLWRVEGETGYPVTYGTSILLAVELSPTGPKAKAFLTYSDTEDRSSKDYVGATERFSRKEWRDVAFTPAQVEADARSTETVKG